MRRPRLPALLLGLPVLVAESSEVLASDGRFPVWPTEIDRVAAPLRDPTTMAESARIAALEELAEYASEVILPDLELALTDPSPEVRKLALQLCAERELVACVDEAEQMWEDGEGSVRLMALQLLSRDPTEDHLELIYAAMEDANDLIREQAIMLLVDAPLDAEQAKRAREEIVAQLSDISARVRRTAARSLGRMGPAKGDAALTLVRLLDDIDQNVAAAAATSIGQLGDPRTAPALRRALENPNNPTFGAAAVLALARLPGPEIDEALLELLDAPPRNVQRIHVAKAIGGRPEPSPELIAGLVARMRDPDLRAAAIPALLWLGDRAVEQLEAAMSRGLEPDIELEVERLLAARRLEPTPRMDPSALAQAQSDQTSLDPSLLELPATDDRAAWFALLGDPEAIVAGAALADRAPGWLEGAIVWQLERAADAVQVRPWLTALAVAQDPLLTKDDHLVPWGRIASWAHDPQASAESRCVATLALGRAAGTRHAEAIAAELRALAAAHLADVRGCAALALVRFGEDPLLEALLADPSARVRAAAALGVRVLRRPGAQLRARLSLQADRDSEMRARTSAALALSERDHDAAFVLIRGRPIHAASLGQDHHWERFALAEREVDVPMLGSDRGWAIVPLAGAAPAVVDTAAVQIVESHGDMYDYHYHW